MIESTATQYGAGRPTGAPQHIAAPHGAGQHGAVRHARPLPPAVRTPRIRPLAQHHEARRHGIAGPAAGPAATQQAPHHTAHPHPHPHPPAGPRLPRHPRAACAPAPHGSPDSPGGPGSPDGGVERALRAELAGRFALRLVEVLAGVRPAGQLQRHTTLDGYGRLTALVRSGPLRPRGHAAARPRLGRVHHGAPSGGVLEACVRVELGARQCVVAFRLERHRRTGQWQCATVESR
ncbi:Rv3235 family protein [Kitasatospora sp. NPDC057015]|uniref:Rv3235 family protein n=1 Tax=Kitasatospora sp. NPDC057015 TaxID=3346001 RepID=UPI0036285319